MSAEIFYLTLTSSDSTNSIAGTALGNAVFDNSFQYPLLFENGNYEVALFSATVHPSTQYNPEVTGSIFCYSNFVSSDVVLGSSRVNLLRRFLVDGPGRSEVNFDPLQFVPLAGSSFSVGRVELRDATGAPISMLPDRGTTVTFAVRRKIF